MGVGGVMKGTLAEQSKYCKLLCLHPVVRRGTSSAMIVQHTISATLAGIRLDEALATLAGISRGEARRIIDRGGCAVGGRMVRVASRLVNTGDQVSAGIMESGRFRELELPSSAILYQDSELVALAKPTGIPSQRTPYQLKGTMEYWVSHFLQQHGKQEPARIVHRLDRGTSGVMLFPKHRQGAARLSALFKDGEIEKYYLAVVSGTPAQEWWEVEGNIAKLGSARWGINPAGRPAKTGFRLLERGDGCALVGAIPYTGRTHQIRVHLASGAELPIVGDATYGRQPAARLMLHCHAMRFKSARGELLTIIAPPPPEMLAFVRGESDAQKGDCADWWLYGR